MANKCYDCGKTAAKISGSDGHHYCEACWNGVEDDGLAPCEGCGKVADEMSDCDGHYYCEACVETYNANYVYPEKPKRVVVARYTTEDVFVVPRGVDLEDTTKVESYYVRWGILHIHFVGGKKMELKPWIDSQDNCEAYKRPEAELEDEREWGDMVKQADESEDETD
jgi:hypothetical protein